MLHEKSGCLLRDVPPYAHAGGLRPATALEDRCFVKRIVSISLCLVTLLMVTGCSRLFPNRSLRVRTVPVANVPDEIVKFERSFNADGVPANMDYDQPHQFTPSEMGLELDVLTLRKFEWGKFGFKNKWVQKPVFAETAREQLVAALVSAFKEATGADRIAFKVPGRKGRETTGEVYIKENELVWIFKAIDGFPFTGKDKYWLDGEQWSIEEKDGLVVKEYKDKQILKVVRDLSVASEVTAAAAAVVEERPPQPPTAAPPEALSREVKEPVVAPPAEVISPGLDELEKKLQTLKKWQESGLITDEDYKSEKAQILQQLQQL
jgi:hypothetical protein